MTEYLGRLCNPARLVLWILTDDDKLTGLTDMPEVMAMVGQRVRVKAENGRVVIEGVKRDG